jgi:hypothetical protein
MCISFVVAAAQWGKTYLWAEESVGEMREQSLRARLRRRRVQREGGGPVCRGHQALQLRFVVWWVFGGKIGPPCPRAGPGDFGVGGGRGAGVREGCMNGCQTQ